jgi:hypothetical protein
MLEPGHQRNMLNGLLRLDGFENVADHSTVYPDILGLGWHPRPRGKIDLGRPDVCQYRLQSGLIGEVHRDTLDARPGRRRAPRHTYNVNPTIQQVSGDTIPDNSSRTNNECEWWKLFRHCVSLRYEAMILFA